MQQRDFHATINIVTWNSEEYIDELLKSLEAQSFQDFYIIAVDNNSTDKTLDIIKKYPRVALIKNSYNAGFSRGHNKGIEMALKFWRGKSLEDRFICIVNPDVVLKKTCLEYILKTICRHRDVAVATPKLLRVYEEEIDGLPHKSRSNIIDSMGLAAKKSRKFFDRMSGKEEKPDLEPQEVFGASGAFMCIRASALQQAKLGKEYFDEDFFAYKEDIDLCWRFKNMGWKALAIPEATAYHHRKIRGKEKISLWQRHKNQKNQPKIIKFLSIRNHIWTAWKNDMALNAILHFPFIAFEEIGKFLYTLLLDTKNIQAYFSAIAGLPKMISKRKYLKNMEAKPKKIRKWFL